VFENAHEVVIKAALPNVDPKQVDITITNDAVTLKGSTKHEGQEGLQLLSARVAMWSISPDGASSHRGEGG